MRRVRTDEGGFGLIELLIAMTVLTIGILAIVAGFSSAAAALVRANRIGTAAVVSDRQMELYRAVGYTEIGLDSVTENTAAATAPYNTDSAFVADAAGDNKVDDLICPDDRCKASDDRPGPDGRTYRVDTYIVLVKPAGDSGRQVKQVTVVVRDVDDGLKELARQVSTFDSLTR